MISSDTDGTVYLRPDPASALYAPEGARCSAQSTIALVEVMKTFTAVRTPSMGEVVSVRVADGDAVQAGQALFWFRP